MIYNINYMIIKINSRYNFNNNKNNKKKINKSK